jgi:PAS domain-containing protein
VAQLPVEIILMRELASHLATPIFVVDPDGSLLFYNEPAERILGARYDETGRMPVDEWSTRFEPTDDEDTPIAPDDLPLVVALRERRPVHALFWIRGIDGERRRIGVTAVPLVGLVDYPLGAAALFWEAPPCE